MALCRGADSVNWRTVLLLFAVCLPWAIQAQTVPKNCQLITFISNQTAQNTIANTLLSEMYEMLGYEVDQIRVDSSVEAYEQLQQGVADVYLSTWGALDKPELLPFGLRGDVKTIQENLTGAYTGLAINHYGSVLGIQRLDQLRQYAKVVDYTIYVGQADWRFAQAIQALIESNLYGLGQFHVMRVHYFDLEQYLKNAQATQKPVVFFARSPSIQSRLYVSHFLQDEHEFFKNFQSSSSVYTSVRYDFPEQCPNAARLLRRFEMTAAMQYTIIDEALQNNLSVIAAATVWLERHTPLVLQWFLGVKTVDGQFARKMLIRLRNTSHSTTPQTTQAQ